jgi:Predicted nucleic-acid-binding protein (contains the HHH domain)
VTLYKDNFRYTLKHISDIIPEANQAIKTLERFGEVIEKALINLTIMEFEDLVTLFEVTTILQKFTLMMRVAEDIEKYIVELGVEGRLIQTQFDEITGDLKKK